jgi:hypothetical protein
MVLNRSMTFIFLLQQKKRTYFLFQFELNGEKSPKNDLDAKTIALAIFDRFGIDKDKRISKQQFIDGYYIKRSPFTTKPIFRCKQNPSLRQIFKNDD